MRAGCPGCSQVILDRSNCLDKVQPRLTKLMISDFKGKLGLSMAVTGLEI